MVGNASVTNEKLIIFSTWTFCLRLWLGCGWDLFHCHLLYHCAPVFRCRSHRQRHRRCCFCCHFLTLLLLLSLFLSLSHTSYIKYVCLSSMYVFYDEISRISFCNSRTFINENFCSNFSLCLHCSLLLNARVFSSSSYFCLYWKLFHLYTCSYSIQSKWLQIKMSK